MSATYEILTIDGIEMTMTRTGKVSWSSNWGLDGIWRLKDQGYLKTKHGGPGTYGHIDFILTAKGEKVATRRVEQIS
jgi:hypothetical protein